MRSFLIPCHQIRDGIVEEHAGNKDDKSALIVIAVEKEGSAKKKALRYHGSVKPLQQIVYRHYYRKKYQNKGI